MKKKFYTNSGTWILINGEVYITNYTINLDQLFEFFNINRSLLITEYNQVILKPLLCSKTFLGSFDRIEFVTIVGGG
uniref:Thiamine biosynthesis protein n=1 Tax=Nannochloropsis gaditana TaxID=72520 RepID=T1RIE7_9STRA|nr:thiamine biosynthesis protein [Nannochloropsis gaditana]